MPKKSAFRPRDERPRGATGRRALERRASPELSHARRAIALLKREKGPVCDYVVTDVRELSRKGRRRRFVVYLQQRYMGLPVYDGRRSVLFWGHAIKRTGSRIPLGPVSKLTPQTTGEAAVRAAFKHVFTSRCPKLEEVAAFASPERFAAFRGEGLSVASAHLAAFVGRRVRLAWVVDLAPAKGERFETVVDARTLGLLLHRPVSQASQACLTLGGRASPRITFDPAWRTSGAVEVSFKNASWQPPQAAANGLICGTEAKVLHPLNAFTLAHRARGVFARFLSDPGPPNVSMSLFKEAVKEGAGAAFSDARGVVLKGRIASPTRFAALDPSVVIHEVSHLMLDAAVGGSTLAHPFEITGESAAVSEGLADFLGLTIWNSVGRGTTPPEAAAEEKFGSYLLAQSRDYSVYFAGGGGPSAPASDPHDQGMTLCGALILARRGLIMSHQLIEDGADEELWRAVCRGLPSLPHDQRRPAFCCVRRVVVDNLRPAYTGTVGAAFDQVGISPACPHISGGGA